MLNNKNIGSKNKHGMLTKNVKTTELMEISEESLNSAIQMLKQQVQRYHNAGFTQVSTWL